MFRIEIGTQFETFIAWAILEDDFSTQAEAEIAMEHWRVSHPDSALRIKGGNEMDWIVEMKSS